MSGTAVTSSNYSYNLDYMGWGGTWRPTFLFFVNKNGTKGEFKTTAGAKYIINMEYTVTATAGNDDWGLQVGLFGGILANGVTNSSSVRITDRIKYQKKDKDKTFSVSAVYTANSAHNIGFQFAGQGTLDIKSIKILELPVSQVGNGVAVKYVNDGIQTGEFVDKNSTPKTVSKEGLTFEGWYDNADYNGNAVKTITADTTLYAKWGNGTDPVVDKGNIVLENVSSPKNIFGSDSQKSISMSGAVITTSNYNYSLDYMGWGSTNRPTFLFLLNKNGTKSEFKTTAGSKYIINMEYTVNSTAGNDSWGLQVGLFGGILANGQTNSSSVRIAERIKYQQKDKGKTFSVTAVYTANGVHNIGLQFAGQGSLDLSYINIEELTADKIADYVIVTYVDGDKSRAAFAKKNGALKVPQKEGYTFDGWYADADLSGEAVTSVNTDTTLYAKWKVGDGKVVVNFHNDKKNTVKTYKVDDPIDVTPEKDGYNFLGWYKYSNFIGRPVTTAVEGLTDLYAKWEEINPQLTQTVDLTKNSSMVTTSKTAQSKVTIEDGKAVFDIYNYERKLSNTDANNDSWFPAYYFYDSNSERITLEFGTTYELEVSYKVIDVKAGDGTGLQIGFGADGQYGQTRTRIKGYAVHTSKDNGKEFSYTTSYTAEKFNFGSTHYPKLLFSGQGTLEVTSIKIKKVLPLIKDTVIGTQTYEEYNVGTASGVLGNKKGTEVSKDANHTSGASSKKSLKLSLNTNVLRLSGNTIISFKRDGAVKPYIAEKGAAYKISFYMYAPQDMDGLTVAVSTVDETLSNDYLTNFRLEKQEKVDLKKGEWKEFNVYIPVLQGGNAGKNLLAIAVCSNGYDGKAVYIDDVTVKQLTDSEVLLYNTMGGDKLDPQRAYANEPFLTFKEPVRNGYLFDGWYYDKEYNTEAFVYDKFPADKTEITLYAKWIKAPTSGYDFTAGSFDAEIYGKDVVPYENIVDDMDKPLNGQNHKGMTQNAVWVKDAGIYGNGNTTVDGAIAFNNELFSAYFDKTGYNLIRLTNEDGTPFIAVKGERYTIEFDYIFASHKGLSYIIPVISEHSAYAGIGNGASQTICRVSVMETDTDYMKYRQSFVAEKTGYVYIALTGRDDNAKVEAHCYEKVYVDNLSIVRTEGITKLDIKYGNTTWYTKYGVKGEKLILPNAVKEGADTFDGFYLDAEFTKKFDGHFPEKDTTIYIKLKKDKYNVPSDFSKPITIDFEETELLEDFYRQQKYMTSWGRETQNEWLLISGDAKNAFNGKNYIKLNGFSHYWNQAKFALYDPKHPENVMLLAKGGKYRVTLMVRCEDAYESPVNMTMCLENPAEKYLLKDNPPVKLEYTPSGDKNGYYMFVGDIEVSDNMAYLPSLAIRRNANDLQTIFIDTVTVEKLRDCKVTYEENGGTVVDDAVVQIHDPVYDPGTPFKDGFVFDGWYTDKRYTKKWDFDNDTVEGDMTLYAKYVVEVVSDDEEDDFINFEDEDGETEGYGEAPNLLDADKVVIDKNTEVVTEVANGIATWVIILICAGAALIAAAAAVVIILIVRKKRKKQA